MTDVGLQYNELKKKVPKPSTRKSGDWVITIIGVHYIEFEKKGTPPPPHTHTL